MPTPRLIATLLVAFALVAAACGDASSDAADATIPDTAAPDATAPDTAAPDTTAPATTAPATTVPPTTEPATTAVPADADFPVTIESSGGTWTLETRPQRVISLSPAATEILFAIGAGDQVIAVDEFSNFPPEAPTTELSGFDPNVEAVTSFEPDLVVLANDANDLVSSLTALDIPVLVSSAPADIETGYATMAELGIATGHIDETADVVAGLRALIDEALASAPSLPIRIYHELDDTHYSASSFGFIGAVYASMGATNIADDADTDGFGFPQLTEEYIVEADPELIIITDQVSYTPDDVAARPGWEEISAVKTGNIVVVSADAASRWGPRLPEFIIAVADALSSAAIPAG